jgi:hypothetical protein
MLVGGDMELRDMFGLVIKLSQLFFRGIWLMLHQIILIIGLFSRLILTAIISLFIGIRESIHRIANDETERAIRNWLPTRYAPQYYRVFRVVAAVIIILGWLGFTLSTVFIITLIF